MIKLHLPAFVLAAACAIASAPIASAQTKITIGEVGSGSSTHWPLYAAIEKGFVAQENIKIEWIAIPSSSAVMQQTAAGSVDIGTGGLVDALRAADKGAPVRLIRIEAGPSPYQVFAIPSVKKWSDLDQKTVMIGGIKDITRIYFEDMAKGNGIRPGQTDYIFAGATAARFAALASGSIAATILTPPFNFRAAREGYTDLGISANYTKSFPFTGYSVNVRWAQNNKPAIKGLLKAYTRGVDWFYDPNNRAEAIAMLVKNLKADPQDISETYDFFTKIKLYDREGGIENSGIDELLKILKAQGDLDGSTDLSRFYDASLIK